MSYFLPDKDLRISLFIPLHNTLPTQTYESSIESLGSTLHPRESLVLLVSVRIRRECVRITHLPSILQPPRSEDGFVVQSQEFLT